MYNNETLLTFGKYKFVRLSRIPAQYLLNLYEQNYPNEELIEYIKNNLENIKDRQHGAVPTPELKKVCDKITYPSEKDAKHEIKKIREIDQKHKKPVRSYECERCGGWHLTSISFEQHKKYKI